MTMSNIQVPICMTSVYEYQVPPSVVFSIFSSERLYRLVSSTFFSIFIQDICLRSDSSVIQVTVSS
jgi:hypothetical protein